MNSIVTRFAPSPTGNLHLGGVRTALINYIVTQQAKKKYPNSKFFLRIEDTDKQRSNNEYKTSIINGLNWLGIKYDNEPFIQSKNIKRHQEIGLELFKKNKAFKCICTNEFLEKKRNDNIKNKISDKKLCKTCENNQSIQSLEKNYVLRIKIPNSGKTSIIDLIQGNINVQDKELDDFILLRKDGSPTYMLSVVVDDYDMGINFIIRGNDHLNNAFRQNYIYINMDWKIPNYAHLPLIHGNDGKKLSKRHGAININNFDDFGYLKESIINNLILLGWSPPQPEEIIKMDNIIKFFDLKNISKSASIFSYDKLNFFNNHFIKNDKEHDSLFKYCINNKILKKYLKSDKKKLIRLFMIYKKNLNNYKELEEICINFFNEKIYIVKNTDLGININLLIKEFLVILEKVEIWEINILENIINNFIKNKNIKFPLFGKPIRLILINLEKGPSIKEILFILGKKNSILRIKNYINTI